MNFVSTGRAIPNAKSEQDKVIGNNKYMVRYEYYPKTITSDTRDFCKAMIQANKLYRKEGGVTEYNYIKDIGPLNLSQLERDYKNGTNGPKGDPV